MCSTSDDSSAAKSLPPAVAAEAAVVPVVEAEAVHGDESTFRVVAYELHTGPGAPSSDCCCCCCCCCWTDDDVDDGKEGQQHRPCSIPAVSFASTATPAPPIPAGDGSGGGTAIHLVPPPRCFARVLAAECGSDCNCCRSAARGSGTPFIVTPVLHTPMPLPLLLALLVVVVRGLATAARRRCPFRLLAFRPPCCARPVLFDVLLADGCTVPEAPA